MPTPKNVAVANEMYPVGAQNIDQLTARVIYIRMLVIDTMVYGLTKRGIVPIRITIKHMNKTHCMETALTLLISLFPQNALWSN